MSIYEIYSVGGYEAAKRAVGRGDPFCVGYFSVPAPLIIAEQLALFPPDTLGIYSCWMAYGAQMSSQFVRVARDDLVMEPDDNIIKFKGTACQDPYRSSVSQLEDGTIVSGWFFNHNQRGYLTVESGE